ncbi:hypothetical protein BMF94_0907 [Rhodotorula taiwanensis]|uniref:ABM domain-containing protein n=1 Tax=Rhodotorula taiwanensis TaxID=741276 RepID=A0A2S5BHF5_9BASI|nr:hypothetical protein BMF94_0907 [Rhodotorula taiwanensis]
MVYTLVCHVLVKPEHVEDMRAELRKATSIYSQDKETIGWHVMQHEDDPTKFAIVERFMHKDSSQEEHLSNPYWKEFNPTVEPWLAQPIEIRRYFEL